VLPEGRRVMLVIGNDVTEARRLEERVRQAQKMDAIGNLAGGVAHDFNNLLSIILSYCDLAVADLAHDDPIRTDLAEIKGAGRRAADLTRQLLTFSRQQVIRPTIEDLNDVLAKLEKMLRRLIGEDVELTVLPAPGLARVEIDAGQIEQVIMNLVVNARDAMPHGGRLTIGTADVLLSESDAASQIGVSPGPYVMMAIGDTGTGMDKTTQARMFEPFFTTKETGKGTGLGLATVFGIVRQSGGTIWVDSEPGKGTKMKVYFPAVARGRVVRASSSSPAPISLRGFETILLVEDEEPVRVLARTILRKYGYNVLEAQGGGDAVLLAEEAGAPIHLLLTDVVMPRLSGPRLAERLVAVRPDMRVLYMSGYMDDAVLRHGIVDATVAFIQKPITPETLARKVREVLDGDRPT
jgi:two-component system, cell cycle sensor histidine kinase and response regulator CckA